MKTFEISYVYIITNILTNKNYIGSRINNPDNDSYMGSSKYLNEDYKLYGIENFEKKIIEVFYNYTKEDLLDKETHFIIHYNTLNPNGYNKHLPNKYSSWHRGGIPLSEEAKVKISNGLKLAYFDGRKIVPDYSGENHPMYGKQHSDEAKIKCGNSMRNKTHKEETKEKMSMTHLGVKKTKEHAKHISEGRQGMIFSDVHKQNISKGKRGKTFEYSDIGKERHRLVLSNLNNKKIKCDKCGKEFNPGNYGRHRKRTCF